MCSRMQKITAEVRNIAKLTYPANKYIELMSYKLIRLSFELLFRVHWLYSFEPVICRIYIELSRSHNLLRSRAVA